MIGNIADIEEYRIFVKLGFDITKSKNLINSFVVIKDEEVELFGEITKIKDSIAHVKLIGEYKDGKIFFGAMRSPSFNAKVYLVASDFVPQFLGDNNGPECLNLGVSSLYGANVNVDIDSFFGNHFAIFGSTGSGKSCGVSRIVQNLFNNNRPKKAKVMIFDAYGEYSTAFSAFGKGTYKAYTTNTKSKEGILKIPLWLLGTDDLALLLSASSSAQLLVIEKALRFVNIFVQKNDKDARKYKNSVIASALLEIISSGRSPVRIRDQVLALLSRYNTEDLNVDTKIVQPGYTRTLKQCLMIDSSGKIQSIELVEEELTKFVVDNIQLSLPDGSFKYTLNDLLDALDFALIDEGIWKSEEVYNSVNFLKIRLQNLIKNETSAYFDLDYITLDEFIDSIFKNEDGSVAQIANFNINYIDDRLAKTITKIYSRLIFDYAKNIDERASQPINIILEEAHRYVQNDSDINVIGYNIFERICKEGRKYGVLMGFISQRPLELSETCISQCSNFLIFKMIHVRDLEFIRGSVPYITDEMIDKVKSLEPGSAMAFGLSFNIPVAVDFMMPNPAPQSESAHVYERWFGGHSNNVNPLPVGVNNAFPSDFPHLTNPIASGIPGVGGSYVNNGPTSPLPNNMSYLDGIMPSQNINLNETNKDNVPISSDISHLGGIMPGVNVGEPMKDGSSIPSEIPHISFPNTNPTPNGDMQKPNGEPSNDMPHLSSLIANSIASANAPKSDDKPKDNKNANDDLPHLSSVMKGGIASAVKNGSFNKGEDGIDVFVQ